MLWDQKLQPTTERRALGEAWWAIGRAVDERSTLWRSCPRPLAETGGVGSSPSLTVVLAGPASPHVNRPYTRAVLRAFSGPERIRSRLFFTFYNWYTSCCSCSWPGAVSVPYRVSVGQATIGEPARSPPSFTIYIRQHVLLALCVEPTQLRLLSTLS